MTIYTVYAKIIRRGRRKHRIKNVAVHTFYDVPVNYDDLKAELLTAAQNIQWEYNQSVTEVTVEMHMAGRYKRAMTSYRQSRIRYGREPKMSARLNYTKMSDTVKVETASFYTPEFYMRFKNEYDREKRRKWQMPKPIPAGFEAMLFNPNMLFVDCLTVKTTTYGQKPKLSYEATERKRYTLSTYAGNYKGMYLGHRFSNVEKEEHEAQAEHEELRSSS